MPVPAASKMCFLMPTVVFFILQATNDTKKWLILQKVREAFPHLIGTFQMSSFLKTSFLISTFHFCFNKQVCNLPIFSSTTMNAINKHTCSEREGEYNAKFIERRNHASL
ncbi:hypothetical protein AMTRI_Chr10g1310 [Amborella trichopoda]